MARPFASTARSGWRRDDRSNGSARGELLVDVTGRIMVMSINRPGARNAVTYEVAVAIAAALDEADGCSDIAVAILTGTSGTFCAGMDLKHLAAGRRAIVPGRGFGGFVEAPPRKPLIAAVEGWALGGGFEMVLACDMTVCRSARFGLPEVKRGLIAT